LRCPRGSVRDQCDRMHFQITERLVELMIPARKIMGRAVLTQAYVPGYNGGGVPDRAAAARPASVPGVRQASPPQDRRSGRCPRPGSAPGRGEDDHWCARCAAHQGRRLPGAVLRGRGGAASGAAGPASASGSAFGEARPPHAGPQTGRALRSKTFILHADRVQRTTVFLASDFPSRGYRVNAAWRRRCAIAARALTRQPLTGTRRLRGGRGETSTTNKGRRRTAACPVLQLG